MDPIARLYAAVYRDPDDPAPRQVLADALLERGDPRGAFIQRQLAAPPSDPAARAAEQAAQQALVRREWLGAAAPAFGELPRFAGGFLYAGTVDGELDEAVLAAPEWATLRELTLPDPPMLPSVDPRLLERMIAGWPAALDRSLRALRIEIPPAPSGSYGLVASYPHPPQLADWLPRLRGLRRLDLPYCAAGLLPSHALAALPPSLERIELADPLLADWRLALRREDGAWVAELASVEVGDSYDGLGYHSPALVSDPDAWGQLLMALPAFTPGLARVELALDGDLYARAIDADEVMDSLREAGLVAALA